MGTWMTSASGKTRLIPSAMAWQAALADKLSLKLSLAVINLSIFLPLSFFQ
jgi:hypothetical protein